MNKDTINAIGIWVLRVLGAAAGIYFEVNGHHEAAIGILFGIIWSFILIDS